MPTKKRGASGGVAPKEVTTVSGGPVGALDGRKPTNGLDDGHVLSDGSLTREHVVEIQRTRMLAAMFDVVYERGFGNASVAHVVGRSGVSRRTFYDVFEDREDCFLAAFDDAVEHAAEHVVRAYQVEGSWREQIRASLVALLGFLEDQPEMGRLIVVEALGAGPRAHERRARVMRQLIVAIDRARREATPDRGLTPLVAEGVVGAVFSVIHTRMIDPGSGPLLKLTSPLMSMIVRPYLGATVAREELARSTPKRDKVDRGVDSDPLRGLSMRLTYRTMRVLVAISADPHASNRQIAEASGVADQGQMSKLLARLENLGLIENSKTRFTRGEPNAWTLTATGRHLQNIVHG